MTHTHTHTHPEGTHTQATGRHTHTHTLIASEYVKKKKSTLLQNWQFGQNMKK